MRRRSILSASVVALVMVGAALAATPKDPKLLVLQQSDFPGGAKKGPSYPGAGGGKDFFVVFNLRGAQEEEVTSEVSVSTTAAAAAAWHRVVLATYTKLPGSSAYALPAYGDEQYADFNPSPGKATLVVRKNRVVWRLVTENCGPLAPAGCLFGRTPPKIARARALAALKKYALREKARVGTG